MKPSTLKAIDIEKLRRETHEAESRAVALRTRLRILEGEGFAQDGIRDPSAPCEKFRKDTPSGTCQLSGKRRHSCECEEPIPE